MRFKLYIIFNLIELDQNFNNKIKLELYVSYNYVWPNLKPLLLSNIQKNIPCLCCVSPIIWNESEWFLTAIFMCGWVRVTKPNPTQRYLTTLLWELQTIKTNILVWNNHKKTNNNYKYVISNRFISLSFNIHHWLLFYLFFLKKKNPFKKGKFYN